MSIRTIQPGGRRSVNKTDTENNAPEQSQNAQEFPIDSQTGVNPDQLEQNRNAIKGISDNSVAADQTESQESKIDNSKNFYKLKENDPLHNTITRARNVAHGIGNKIMLGSCAVGAALYGLLGMRRIATILTIIGVSIGFGIKKLIAPAGKAPTKEEAYKDIIKDIKKSDKSSEEKIAMIENLEDIYRNLSNKDSNSNFIDKSLQTVRDKISSFSKAPEANPEMAPA